MYKYFILILLSTGCVPLTEDVFENDPEFETGIDEIQNIDYKYTYNKNVGGASFHPNDCDFYKQHPLVMDPNWSDTSKEYIRAGVRLWEAALGIDLGDVPVSEENCGRYNRVISCIVKIDDYKINEEDNREQIYIYNKLLMDHNYSPEYLTDIIAHEVGHFLMISHTTSGVMATNRGLIKNPQITSVDIDAYSSVCN